MRNFFVMLALCVTVFYSCRQDLDWLKPKIGVKDTPDKAEVNEDSCQAEMMGGQQTGINYGFFVHQNGRWQIFAPKTQNLTKFSLFIRTVDPTGDFTLRVQSEDGGQTYFETTQAASVLPKCAWYLVDLEEPIQLDSAKKYRIVLSRTDDHSAQNAIYWKGLIESTYPEVCDVNPSWETYDYAFKTYGMGNVPCAEQVEQIPINLIDSIDQRQDSVNYGFGVPRVDYPRWQQFIPTVDYITKIELYVSKVAPTGTCTFSLQSEDGMITYASKTVMANDLPKFGWYEIDFGAPVSVEPGQTYRISMYRSDSHSPENAVYWRGHIEANYPSPCDVTGDYWTSYNYAFRVYGANN